MKQIKFNPENKDILTYGEALGPVADIVDQEEADQYLKEYIKYTQKFLDEKPHEEGKTAEEICKINIGYWSGWCSNETAERILKLFDCSHPIFGKKVPTPKEAFEAGKKLAEL